MDSIERRITQLEDCVIENKARVDQLADDYEKLTRHREMLVAALTEITEAYRTAAGLVPVVVAAAERVLEEIAADGFYDEIPPHLERQQVDRWIDATGTAPPGVDLDLDWLNAAPKVPKSDFCDPFDPKPSAGGG
jgi:hypothetical protein